MKHLRSRGLLAVAAIACVATGFVLDQTATAAPSDPTPTPDATAAPSDPTPTPDVTAATGDRRPRVVWYFTALSDGQRQCLADQGLQRPQGRLSEEQRDALRADVDKALATCGITLPARMLHRERLGFAFAALSPDQQQCLADVHLTRPVGRLTPEQRTLLRAELAAAVAACGITPR